MRKTEHFLLLTWLLTTGLVAVGAWVVVDQGLLAYLIATDRSFVSVIVIGMYLVGVGHSFLCTRDLSLELNRIAAAERVLGSDTVAPIRLVDGRLDTGGAALPEGFLSNYVRDLLRSGRSEGEQKADTQDAGADLLEAAAARLRSRYEFGWFLIDLMLKVGFVGTLIGFIWMLASVSQHEIIDATSMQGILKEMSFGMSTALNTTLSSLLAGILLSFPYYLLGRGLEELLETTVRLARAEVLPRLAAA